MPRITAFKAHLPRGPARTATPPPPQYEPLSPVLQPAVAVAVAVAAHAAAGQSAHAPTTLALPPQRLPHPQHAQQPHHAHTHHSHSHPHSHLQQPHPHILPPSPWALGSPIEALADAAAATAAPAPAPVQRTSPAYIEPPPLHKHTRTASSSLVDARPAKRARSEFYHASPPHAHHYDRPATSHIPGWSYNVEHMSEAGIPVYHDPVEPADNRISDAQLLLDFFQVSAHTAQTPPSTAKRWSISHPAPPEQHIHQQPQPQPPPPHYPLHAHHLPHTHANAHTHHHTHPHSHVHAHAVSHTSHTSGPLPPLPPDVALPAPAVQTHTPPEEVPGLPQSLPYDTADPKPKKHQGWPKGKPRGPRTTPSTSKRKKSTPKPKSAPTTSTSTSTSTVSDQLQSPQSLPADHASAAAPARATLPTSDEAIAQRDPPPRRRSLSNTLLAPPSDILSSGPARSQSVPLHVALSVPPPADTLGHAEKTRPSTQPELICAACHSSDSAVKVGDGEQWIGCDGCKEWHHYACAGFSSEREVRDVNKFYCEPCRPRFGETTKVRKSIRAHTTVDYAGLNEGVLKTSDDNPEHHYISALKNGDLAFTPETFARMPPELVSADFLEKSNGFKEPILIPGELNPRPWSSSESQETQPGQDQTDSPFEYEAVPDDGQDKLDMIIPKGLTVRRVAELYGPNETVPVIDVKAQEGEGKKWTMSKWADYYEQQGEKPVRNVISLEVSRSRLGRLIQRPKAVRDMDLQDSVWREEDKFAPPPVQFYCLMSVADCFTDFHIDFGGSSVYYHIVKGKKVFFFIPPTKQNMKKYEDWCLSPNQGHEWLGKQVKDCYRVDLYPGDTMLIPSGWIHAVWTPEDSLVIGGNFLTRIHYGMQIRVLEVEKNTKVAQLFRYPFFQKIMWLTVIKYLEEDPVPASVQELLQRGEQFKRSTPIYCEPDKFGHNSHPDPPNYNRRYYPKHELEGLTDLMNYIWRTVLISLDKVDLPQKTRNAVTRSIPKGHGEPIVLARHFAMWIAWKRGNENIPAWALPDANLPEVSENGEKKLSAAQVKKIERESLNEALRATAERSSARIRASDASPPSIIETTPQVEPVTPSSVGPLTGFLRPSATNPHITTPKTSQLGPKRVACDACRKRRIRCKHKDELVDTSKPGMHTIDLSGSYGISVKRRLSDHSIVEGHSSAANGPVNGGPIMADVNGDPYALKSGRVKACADCRKSKRRCIHDEYGNVDPIKANEVPVPRGSTSKKRRVSDDDSNSFKRMKLESATNDDETTNGDVHARHSLPIQFNMGGSLLQDIAYSAQQALNQSPDDEAMPIDPTLQAYANGDYSTSYPPNGDTVVSSIEDHHGSPEPMEDVQQTRQNGGPSVEPLTPGPGPVQPAVQSQTNGAAEQPPAEKHQTASPISPRHVPTAFPTSPTTHNHNMFTTGSDFPPPITPVAATRSSRAPNSSGGKTNQTPSRATRQSRTPRSTPSGRRRDSKDGIKLEQGLGVGMGLSLNMGIGMGINLDLIDPNLDQASIDLIKQLQAEEHGLRRRSRGAGEAVESTPRA